MKRPTEQEIRDLLKAHAPADKSGELRWRIDGHWFVDAQALRMAELALLTGQPLSAFITPDLLLNLARRLAVLEERLERLDPERTVPVTGLRFDSGNGAPTRDWRRLSPELPGSADAQTCTICGASPFVPCSREAHTEIAEQTGGTDE